MSYKEAYKILKKKYPDTNFDSKVINFDNQWVFRRKYTSKVVDMPLYFVDHKGNITIKTVMSIRVDNGDRKRFMEAAQNSAIYM